MCGRKSSTTLSAMTPAIYEFDLQSIVRGARASGSRRLRPPVGRADLSPVPGGPGDAAHRAAARPQAGRPGTVLLRSDRA